MLGEIWGWGVVLCGPALTRLFAFLNKGSSSQSQLSSYTNKDDTKTNSQSEAASPTVSVTPGPNTETEPIRDSSIAHERSNDSPETSELKPKVKQRKEEAETQSKDASDVKQTDSPECVGTSKSKTIGTKKSVCKADSGDIRKYTTDTKDGKISKTSDTRPRREHAERRKGTGRKQVQQHITDILPVRRSTRKCKALIEVGRWILHNIRRSLICPCWYTYNVVALLMTSCFVSLTSMVIGAKRCLMTPLLLPVSNYDI